MNIDDYLNEVIDIESDIINKVQKIQYLSLFIYLFIYSFISRKSKINLIKKLYTRVHEFNFILKNPT